MSHKHTVLPTLWGTRVKRQWGEEKTPYTILRDWRHKNRDIAHSTNTLRTHSKHNTYTVQRHQIMDPENNQQKHSTHTKSRRLTNRLIQPSTIQKHSYRHHTKLNNEDFRQRDCSLRLEEERRLQSDWSRRLRSSSWCKQFTYSVSPRKDTTPGTL